MANADRLWNRTNTNKRLNETYTVAKIENCYNSVKIRIRLTEFESVIFGLYSEVSAIVATST